MWLNFIAGLITVAGLSTYVNLWGVKKWNEREYFAPFAKMWKGISLFASIGAVMVGAIVDSLTGLVFIQYIPFIVLAYVFLFSGFTDAKSGYAPSELAWAGIWASLPFMVAGIAVSGDNWGATLGSLVVWGLVAFLLYFNRGLGDADVRLLWLVNVAVIWWVGLYWGVMLFTAAAMLQLVVHLFAGVFNYGRLVEVKYNSREMSYRRFAKKFIPSIDLDKEARMRRHVPFIPALTFTYVAGLTLLIVFIPEQLNVFSLGLMSM